MKATYNLHAPERYPDESQADYRDRQEKSRIIARRVWPTESGETGRPNSVFYGQHTNRARNEQRDTLSLVGRRQYRKLMTGGHAAKRRERNNAVLTQVWNQLKAGV